MSGNSSPSHSSNTSLSLSPGLLPEKNTVNEQRTSEQQEESSISENILSINSLENDRSLIEIEISNILDLHTIIGDNEADLINASPPLSLNLSNLSNSAGKNAKSVLEEILQHEQFKSEQSDMLDSNDEVSMNIFDGVNLDDNSINNYGLKLKGRDGDVVLHQDDAKVRSLEGALGTKESIIRALSAEVESLKDLASNPSTLSMNTTLTEYKMFQEECAAKFVSYENALGHRDALIEKLKESLISAQKHEDEMRTECEQYSKDIQRVRKELADAVAQIRTCKCKCLDEAEATSAQIVMIGGSNDEVELETMYSRLEGYLLAEEVGVIRGIVCDYVDVKLKRKEEEISRLQEKHVKEMEDTRKFYERKCADIMSDELVSQSGKKVFDDDTPSEDELSDFGAADCGTKLSVTEKELTPEVVQAFKRKIDAASQILNKYNMENLGEDALNSLKSTLDSFKVPLVISHFHSEVETLRAQLRALQEEKEHRDSCGQANVGELEIDGIVKSYRTRLAEQVELAKIDIMTALEENISKLATSDCEEDDWPKEFLEIRNKLTFKLQQEIANTKESHDKEIFRLKQDLQKARSRSMPRSEDLIDDEEVVKERKTTSFLRNLLIDCYKYFAQCEEELNTTLFDELAKQALFDSESDCNANDASTSSSSKTDTSMSKRVHLVPNIKIFIEKIERNSADVSLELRHELNTCLDRLRTDANAILALTAKNSDTSSGIVASGSTQSTVQRNEAERLLENKIQSLAMQLAMDAKDKEELNVQLLNAKELVKTLEMERCSLDKQMEGVIAKNRITEDELAKARDKIGELIEYGRKEIVSEGYGENAMHGGTMRTPLVELNHRARQFIAENKNDAKTLQIIEDLSRECDHLVEDAKRERRDFALQIESADKKLRSTQRFLEEQAAEREQERDEAQKTINALHDQLKDRQKDRVGYERVNEVTLLEGSGTGTQRTFVQYVQAIKSVEGFEQQMHEMSRLMADGEKRYQEVNAEREEAIEKIGLLRDIIKDLENQIKAKEDLEEELKFLLEKQREATDYLVQQLEAASNTTNFQTHIIQLEEEVTKLRRASDIVGNEGLIKEIQLQLHELELSVDKNIREIELLYATKSATTCSTPSEEMSVQDQIRPKTPNSTADDCEVPLQQLARLKEKLLKHSRAESSAIKRIQDMELQLLQAKQEQDELHNEKTMLQEQVSEHLVLISSLQMRLDDQRIRAEHVQKQANASLEMRIYDLENDLQALRDKLQSRESSIKQLNKIINETKQRLKDREDELSSTLEESEVCLLKTEIERLKSDNAMLRLKIESDAQNAQILPSLVDNIIADKNKDIEILRAKLEDAERQLEMLRSLSAVDEGGDNRGGLSYFNISSPERLRSAASINSMNVTRFVPEISSIERVGPPNVDYTTDASLMKPNSTEIQKTAERHVHFEDDSVMQLPPPVFATEAHPSSEEFQHVKDKLNEAEATVSELRVDLAEAKMHLAECQTEMNNLRDDAKRKDDMYMELAKEKRDIEKQFNTLDAIRSSVEELQSNEHDMKALLQEARDKYSEKEASFKKLKSEYVNYRNLKEEEQLQCAKVHKERCETYVKDFEVVGAELKACRAEHSKEMAVLKQALDDRESKLELSNDDVRRYQSEILALEDRLKERPTEQLQDVVHKKELAEKELEIVKLTSMVDAIKRNQGNLLGELTMKDEIIDGMRVDSETLRINLETIKTKMNEAGNIYDLRAQLKRERDLNAVLLAANNMLTDKASIDDTSKDEVAEQMRKQLNDSANLDDMLLAALVSGDIRSEHEIPEVSLNEERRGRLLVKYLETKLKDSMCKIRQLNVSLNRERKLFENSRTEDTDLIIKLRGRLDEEMENATECQTQLDKERTLRTHLESEMAMLRAKLNAASQTSTTEYIPLQNMQEQRLLREVKQLHEEVGNLKQEVKNLKKGKNSVEGELKYSKQLLDQKTEELAQLEQRLEENNDELDKKNLEYKTNMLLVSNLEQAKEHLSKQLALLESRQQDSSAVPSVLMQKINDLGKLVIKHSNENRILSETIAKVSTERNQLEWMVHQLEEREQDGSHMPFDDPVARANHLFGKYLRAESYRNALTYQKNYLLNLLSTYQDAVGRPLRRFEPKKRHTRGERVVNRFRSAVVVLIAIFRMKYMVQRWRSGTRKGTYAVLHRFRNRGGDSVATHFQIGNPISDVHFRITGTRPVVTAVRPLPGNHGASTSNTTSVTPNSETFEQLRPPTVELDSYFERFNLIQQRLGTTWNNYNS